MLKDLMYLLGYVAVLIAYLIWVKRFAPDSYKHAGRDGCADKDHCTRKHPPAQPNA